MERTIQYIKKTELKKDLMIIFRVEEEKEM
jgi:hypothetical protein